MTIPVSTGYEDPPPEESKIPPPEEVKWLVQIALVGESVEEKDIVFVTVEVDGESLGLLRLPNGEYLRWLRERIQGDGT